MNAPNLPRSVSAARGFTLVEMLVVVLVIVILSAMTLRTVGAIGRNNDISKTRAQVERVATACEEFKAIYGKYPPVSFYPGGAQPFEFEHATVGGMGDTESEGLARNIRTKDRRKEVAWRETRLFTFGLLSFFLPRYNGFVHAPGSDDLSGYPYTFAGVTAQANGNGSRTKGNALSQYVNYNKFVDGAISGDTERDLAAVRRILPILGGKLKFDNSGVEDWGIISRDVRYRANSTGEGASEITNRIYTVYDAWGNSLHYQSIPPYETFKVWSYGPDGKTGVVEEEINGAKKEIDYSRDDIVAGQE